jgi:hypothetical protein
MLPGETTLTRMLYGANSEASPRAIPISPIFAADKCVRPLPLAEIEPSPQKNRMRPWFARCRQLAPKRRLLELADWSAFWGEADAR